MIQLKRAYAKPSPEDGFRVLVDRFWPRDLTEKHAKVDLWLQNLAPAPSCTLISEILRLRSAGRNLKRGIERSWRTNTKTSRCSAASTATGR